MHPRRVAQSTTNVCQALRNQGALWESFYLNM